MNQRYYFHEGLSNMFAHGFMSFAAVGITVACLLIMGTFSLVAVNAQNLLDELESENEILAYVDEGLEDAQVKALQGKLEGIEGVASVRFISRDEAMKSFQEKYADEPLFKDLEPEVFRHRYVIKVTALTMAGEVAAALASVDGIAKVNAYEELTSGFIAVRNIAGVVCIALIAILFIVSIFIISNTIKLTTFDRREEIGIMKMVGATDSFIRWPFVYEGLLLGIFASAVGFALQWLLYNVVARAITANDTVELIHVVDFGTIWPTVALIFGISGIFIGICGSLSAIRKFLQV